MIIDFVSGYNAGSFNLDEFISSQIDKIIERKSAEIKIEILKNTDSAGNPGIGPKILDDEISADKMLSINGIQAARSVSGGDSVDNAAYSDEIQKYSNMSDSELRAVYDGLSPEEKERVKQNKDKIKRALGR